MNPTFQIITGHFLDVANRIPDASIQTCVTSPPYWSLRDYGLPPVVWDADPDCAHEWGATVPGSNRGGSGRPTDKNGRGESYGRDAERGNFCQCGAWRGSLGLEPTPELYVQHIVQIFREVWRALKPDGTLWLNLGDCYAGGGNGGGGSFAKDGIRAAKAGTDKNVAARTGSRGVTSKSKRIERGAGRWGGGNAPACGNLKPKDMVGIPWRVAFALQADGWYLRSDIIWAKKNCMPESVQGSHYSRHRVTIEEYERLSHMPYIDERAGDAWAGDMPKLSEGEISSNQAPLSAIGQRNSDSKSERRSSRRKREAPTIQSISLRETEQSQVRGDQQRQSHTEESARQVPPQSTREGRNVCTSPGNEGPAQATSPEASGKSQVSKDRQREGSIEASECTTTGSNSRINSPTDSRRVDGNLNSARPLLPLLQEEDQTNTRSRYSAKQGRTTHKSELRACVQPLQFEETQQPDVPLLVGCPGCKKCLKHHGYIFHLSAGRPTKAHEYIFLLSKRPKYFYDAEAIKDAGSPNTHPRLARGQTDHARSVAGVPGQTAHSMHKPRANTRGHASGEQVPYGDPRKGQQRHGNGIGPKSAAVGSGIRANESFHAATAEVLPTRNARSVWHIATAPFSEAHFATFPPELAERCIKAGSRPGDTVLDPFSGAGTTVLMAIANGRSGVGVEMNPEYVAISERRIRSKFSLFVGSWSAK